MPGDHAHHLARLNHRKAVDLRRWEGEDTELRLRASVGRQAGRQAGSVPQHTKAITNPLVIIV